MLCAALFVGADVASNKTRQVRERFAIRHGLEVMLVLAKAFHWTHTSDQSSFGKCSGSGFALCRLTWVAPFHEQSRGAWPCLLQVSVVLCWVI